VRRFGQLLTVSHVVPVSSHGVVEVTFLGGPTVRIAGVIAKVDVESAQEFIRSLG
jgi:hypothetical protein